MTTVTIDGVEFRDDGTTGRVYTRLDGWYSSPPVRAAAQDRPNADGAFAVTRAYRSARPIRFEGALYADTSAEAIGQLWATTAGIQATGEPFELTVEDDFGPLTCLVSVDGAVEIQPLNRSAAQLAVSFIAYDPVKYGPSRNAVTGLPAPGGGLEYPLHNDGVLEYGANGDLGRVTLFNAGTAPVWPVFTVTAEFTEGFSVRRLDTNRTITYSRVVPAGTDVRIESRTGAVLVDGTSDGSTYLTRSEFFSVDPGESFEVQLAAINGSAGTPQMTVTTSDGYW